MANASNPVTGYPQIVDSLSTALLVMDRNLLIRYMNPAAENLLAVSATRSHGMAFSAMVLVAGDTERRLKAAADHGRSFSQHEVEYMLVNGARMIVDYTVTPISSEGDLLLEIWRRDQLLRINREEDILSQQETNRVLVRGMAHEIKNPLGGIRGAAQLLDRELQSAELREYTQVIIDEADRLRSLVDRMLGPNKAPRLIRTNVHEVLERVRALLEAESHGKLTFKRDYDPSLPEFCADREQLIQAFLNIARNAMEACLESPDGPGNADSHGGPHNHGNSSSKTGKTSEPATITFRTRALRQFTIGPVRHRLVCRVDVIDNGPGISPQLQQNIFYPMISGRASGNGLGLAITQSIIGRHHGLVECNSEPGHTNFVIYLPLEECT
ncbi:nitrogen regulation protein NR(II) [Marinobacter sp. LV10MA510-1]|uniref:nitrogen regulation protein NR(II) n=1 Tax=Marinobacter sp. LV10MA510-1 TaxID=1415567 RepID=UPI000BF28844|nr:nitrogen regulation protein NR(II) [Marinobacter sp. LV10MA510-1]PFG09935.1 two-component system nitrogen regulation sensor histidine kinase GlnL [Marinobacter sp. LV10MA510-1]